MCSKKELPDLAEKLPIESIIQVSDEMFRPYILLKDVDDVPYWRPYGGEKIEDVRRFHKWELDAQKIYRDKSRSSEELDAIKNLILSTTLIVEFFEMGQEMLPDMIDTIISKTAELWYCKDNDLHRCSLDREKHEDDLKVYYSLAAFYVQSFINTYIQVQQTVATTQAGQ